MAVLLPKVWWSAVVVLLVTLKEVTVAEDDQVSRQKRSYVHPHTHLTAPELIRVRGYPVEIHHVVTDDGYILELHRIPYSPRASSNVIPSFTRNSIKRSLNLLSTNTTNAFTSGKSSHQKGIGKQQKVVYIQHCLLCSTADFIMNDPDQALGFMLSDAGYDVWFGNLRGNIYSRRHLTLTPKHPKFWDFSLTNMTQLNRLNGPPPSMHLNKQISILHNRPRAGHVPVVGFDTSARYDVPAMLKYVRATTGVSQLSYVGHSMGTTVFFAMMNYHPHINSWVRVMAAMSPVAYLHTKHSPLRLIVPFINELDRSLTKKNQLEFLTPSKASSSLFSKLCSNFFLRPLCQAVIDAIGGPSSKNVDPNYMPVILAHTPAGTSFHVLTHLLQIVKDKRFQAFDWGLARNYREYGAPKPPRFDLSHVRTPVGLFWSRNDWVADPRDVQRTARELPNLVLNHQVQHNNFNHLDFIWAENAGYLVYRHVIDFLNRYN